MKDVDVSLAAGDATLFMNVRDEKREKELTPILLCYLTTSLRPPLENVRFTQWGLSFRIRKCS